LFIFNHEFLIVGTDSSCTNIQVENRSKYRNDPIKMEELRQALINRTNTQLNTLKLLKTRILSLIQINKRVPRLIKLLDTHISPLMIHVSHIYYQRRN